MRIFRELEHAGRQRRAISVTNSFAILSARILIVDDNPSNILLLERTLRDAGYGSIMSTTDPFKVCDLYRENHYDLVLLDLEMPGMDGFQVMADLKCLASEGYVPIMVLTANPIHKLRALHGGAKDFLSKPFDLAEVLVRVRNMLEVRLLHERACDHGRQLESLVRNDPLTGLGNRRLLAERMSMAIAHARRKKRSMAAIYLDLDGFKQINDTLGHGVGDALLKMVADRLTSMVREEDTLVRMGGDEFVIVISDLGGCSDLNSFEHFGDVATVASKAIKAKRPSDAHH